MEKTFIVSREKFLEIKREAEKIGINTYPMIEDDGVFTALSFKPCDISHLSFLRRYKLKLA
jgi:hypothetical protein